MSDSHQTLMLQESQCVPSAAAIGALGRESMAYAALRELQISVREDLARCGIGRTDRVAIILPNGPAMASCFMGIAGSTGAAPLNPGYRETEFEFYLSDLEPGAVIVAQGTETPARDVALRLGIRIIELVEDTEAAAGKFTFEFTAAQRQPATTPAGADDVALVLHTSGTTSRPKIVPLSQANLCASARHIAQTLALTPQDRCLNIMPLFHIHGLIAAVLATVSSGGEVVCSPGFNAVRFFAWLDQVEPSWYTAVPTMHQLILERVSRNREIADTCELRFIRSSSASLPAPVMESLGQTFSCPVIESYGMTEACHQMTSNPLPPAPSKAGSVGLPAGPEVRLMGEDGQFVEDGTQGEIVIRGPNVTAGYEKNPNANASGFQPDPDGGAKWFRTGDLGVFDDDNYLRIDGRIKEIINRGGEKISPREVDDVLIEHQAIKQIVTFAVRHSKLGEDVAAAVILHEGATLTEKELRYFAGERLASFKVPRTVCFVDEIPKGSTGKLQRIGLAGKLGLE
ncbi:MAG: acyl--CoA ligase [Pseudomonadota bacterium]|nr:acyl--CoA ligase [Pseudomonadota bacterium]